MLVYGDARRTVATATLFQRIRADRDDVRACTGAARHDALVRWLLDAGELAQGLLDHRRSLGGADTWSPVEAWIGEELGLPARALAESVSGRCLPIADEAATNAEMRGGCPDAIDVSVPEGYAVYAVYPELYALAAMRELAALQRPLVVVGVRTIGASLGAVVAAAAGAQRFLTVRPVGHPFDRAVALDSFASELLIGSGAPATYAVVDEGPGLSGSSFGAVADWLEDHGVPRSQTCFFPSHAGPVGTRASARTRERWDASRRTVRTFDGAFFRSVVLRSDAPVEDLSGGAWRRVVFGREDDWPPVHTEERRKYLVDASDGRFLYKFAGLGRYGDAKLERARLLAGHGLVPPPTGLARGFLVQPWLDGAPIVPDGEHRADWLATVARYLCVLVSSCPAPPGVGGASPRALLDMARHNTRLALGPMHADLLSYLDGIVGEVETRARPIASDNKMHTWEWLRTRDGRILKCDALDHHQGHDLVGAQDVAWDVAGAIVEGALNETESARLLDEVRSCRAVTRAQLAFYVPAYLAFQVGRATLALETAGARSLPDERARWAQTCSMYRERLRLALELGERR